MLTIIRKKASNCRDRSTQIYLIVDVFICFPGQKTIKTKERSCSALCAARRPAPPGALPDPSLHHFGLVDEATAVEARETLVENRVVEALKKYKNYKKTKNKYIIKYIKNT